MVLEICILLAPSPLFLPADEGCRGQTCKEEAFAVCAVKLFMDNIEITLTPVDRAILDSYAAMVPGLSAYLGSHYEIVLHSLASLSSSVIAICNGHHTCRVVGSPITDLALQMLSEIRASRSYVAAKNYFTTKKDGTHLKSTTIPIRGENQRIIGLLCMNLYLDTPLSEVLASLLPETPSLLVPAAPAPMENFATSSQSLIADMVERVSTEVHRDKSIPTACKNKVIVERLYAQGIFSFKESIVRVAELLGINKNTVYMHVRNIRSAEEK